MKMKMAKPNTDALAEKIYADMFPLLRHYTVEDILYRPEYIHSYSIAQIATAMRKLEMWGLVDSYRGSDCKKYYYRLPKFLM